MAAVGTDDWVRAIQVECVADDVEATDAMRGWNEAQLRLYFESGGAVQPSPTDGSPPPPMRVLCLHGSGSNRGVMEYQTRLLRSALGDGATFDYLEGQRPFPIAEMDQTVRMMFGAGPYFGWYGVSNDASKSDSRVSYLQLLEDPSVVFTYSEVEAAIEKLETFVAEHGPFDALLGFSQGAIVATLATALALERQQLGTGRRLCHGAAPERTTGWSRVEWVAVLLFPTTSARPPPPPRRPGPSWRHLVLVCGMPPRDNRYLRFFDSRPLAFPSTLVYGKRDPFYA